MKRLAPSPDPGRLAKTAAVALLSLMLTPALILAAMGCGSSADSTAPSIPETTPAQPSSVQLLNRASSALGAQLSADLGVHFVMDASSTSNGDSTSSSGEGDMLFPDSVSMTTHKYAGPTPVDIEVVSVGGRTYTRSPSTGGSWKSVSGADAGVPLPDPYSLSTYLNFVRSSRLVGEESLKGNRRTYHVQASIDSVMAANDAARRASDPALVKSLEENRSASVNIDLWLGEDDGLIYQETIHTVNPITQLSSQVNFVFSDWGKQLHIGPPCEAC